mmetsp:Transcript_7459/g.17683  ORF Transcript_7459/g.17683 Transcript_7459/m.17683 type:complete len:100 (+) Transcript_7459:63-362(+)
MFLLFRKLRKANSDEKDHRHPPHSNPETQTPGNPNASLTQHDTHRRNQQRHKHAHHHHHQRMAQDPVLNPALNPAINPGLNPPGGCMPPAAPPPPAPHF